MWIAAQSSPCTDATSTGPPSLWEPRLRIGTAHRVIPRIQRPRCPVAMSLIEISRSRCRRADPSSATMLKLRYHGTVGCLCSASSADPSAGSAHFLIAHNLTLPRGNQYGASDPLGGPAQRPRCPVMMPLPENFMDMVPTRNPGSATMLKLRYHVKAGCSFQPAKSTRRQFPRTC